MRKISFIIPIIAGLMAMGCVSTGKYNTQKGAALGAGLGALYGQAIGQNTESTLIGAGVGTLLGSIVGNHMDQQADEYRAGSAAPYNPYDRNDPYYGNVPYGHQKDNRYENRYDDRYADRYTKQSHRGYRQAPPGRWVMVPGHWEGRHWIPAHEVWMPVNPR